MSKSDFWKRMFLGASLFLFSTATVLAVTESKMKVSVVDGIQQDRTITCLISDEMGPVPGANVMVKGTTNGTISDMDGRAVLSNVPNNAVLTISFVGYLTQEVRVNNQTNIRVTLVEDSKALDEVVVVGYGTQAKKDITGSVAVVSAEALSETPVSTFAEALQGKASGVYVSSTGAPGAETTIRIRGVGSVNGSDPLIVVDGVSNVSIDAVNPNDIESLQVLKDASATAIYGAQGANGVIIITTKQGTKAGKVRISYDGYVGFAKMANDGYDVLNAWEHMEFQAMGMVNARDIRKKTTGLSHSQFGTLDANDQLTMPYAIKPAGLSEAQVVQQFGSIAAWEASYKANGSNSWTRSAYYQMLKDGYSEEEARAGTDWYDLATQTGLVQEHQISAMGGGDKGMYSMSVGYHSREGTIKSSAFERYSLRSNATFNANKYFTIGQNTNLAVMEMTGERGWQGDDNTFGKSFSIQPWVPVYNIAGDFAGSTSTEGGRAETTMMAVTQAKDNWTRHFRGQTAVFAELKPIEGLSIKTQFSARLNGTWERNFYPITITANKEGRSQNYLQETANWRFGWQWTNTATYTKKFNEDHNMTVVVGTEAMKMDLGRYLRGARYDYIFENDDNTWTLNNGSTAGVSNDGYMYNNTTMFGFFARGDYSYQGKYLATLTVRRDASSRFGENNRWGTFPSASLGWRISDEAFMERYTTWLDDLKLRAGYGTTGNSNIGAYNYAFQYATGANYGYAMTGGDTELVTGYGMSHLGDANAKWETTKMLNVGFDATLLNNRMTLGFDYYIKKTSDMLVPANWSALAGSAIKPNINIGDIKNTGVDFSIGWRDQVGKVKYNVSANLSTYKNTVERLGSSDLFNSTRLSDINITTEGQPIGMFYGYKVAGIYQSADDVMNNKDKNGNTILPYGAVSRETLNPDDYVGRYKMQDTNGDGIINGEDRTIIGNPHPDLTGGFNLGLNWNNWDLSTYMYFSIGNDLYRHYMYYTHFGALQSNYSKDRRDNSWHPTNNPDGIYPLWAMTTNEGDEASNVSHSGYIQDGSYLRMQTLTLGYTLPKPLLSKIGLERLRVYGQISNVFTITGYDGLDPEVRSFDSSSYQSSDRNKGVDYGSYGSPRQFILGVNVSF